MTDDSKRRVRLAYVLRPAAGGMRRHVEMLLTHLDKNRYAITLFAPPDTTLSVSETTFRPVPLAIAGRTSPFADASLIRHLAQDLRGNFDLIHAHGLRGALIGVLAAERAGIPAVFTAHNLATDLSLPARVGLVYVARHARRIIAVSQSVAETLTATGVAADRIAVIPNGVDLCRYRCPPDTASARSQFGIEAESPLLVAVGRFSREKGFDVLLDAMPHIRKLFPTTQLALVGDGPQETELRRRAEIIISDSDDPANAPPILFTGRLDDPTLLLCAADLVVVPSRQEGQGLVALEAMAAGKPVVASRVGGLRETILPNVTGLLIPPDDSTALAEAVSELLPDAARCAAMRRAGRARVEQEFTRARMIARTEQVYDEALT